jgi:hypothetical protein
LSDQAQVGERLTRRYKKSSFGNLRQLLYCSIEIALLPPHPEIDHRSPTATGKAMPVVAFVVDPKARVMVVVE